MDSKEFADLRRKLGKTQKQMAQLFGTSIKAIHSYEQGWRTIPAHVERQIFFLVFQKLDSRKGLKPCWSVKQCPARLKKQCPAWEFKTGKLCWFVCGTHCDGDVQPNWSEKMKICRRCEVFNSFMASIPDE